MVGVLGVDGGVEPAVTIVQPSITHSSDVDEPVNSRLRTWGGGLAERQQRAVADCASLSHDEFGASDNSRLFHQFSAGPGCRRSHAAVLGSSSGVVRHRRGGALYRDAADVPDNGFRSTSKLMTSTPGLKEDDYGY